MRLLKFVTENGCLWIATNGLYNAIGVCEILSNIHRYHLWGEVNKRALKMALSFFYLFYNSISNILTITAGNNVIIHITLAKLAEEMSR